MNFRNLIFFLAISLSLSCSSLSLSESVPEPGVESNSIAWFIDNFGLVNHVRLDHYLNNLEDKLSKAAQVAHLKFTGKHSVARSWKLLVLNTDSENAFFAGGNVILLTKGLLRNLQNEAELAAIIAHEMSHSLLGHVLQSPRPLNGSTNAPQYFFSIGNEIEADIMSTHILESAAYDISHALTAFDIIYRQTLIKPFNENAEWLKKRQAMLLQLIDKRQQSKYSISNTREFARIKRYLNGKPKASAYKHNS